METVVVGFFQSGNLLHTVKFMMDNHPFLCNCIHTFTIHSGDLVIMAPEDRNATAGPQWCI